MSARLIAIAAERDCAPPEPDQLAEIQAFSQRLMDHQVAPEAALRMVLEIQPGAIFVYRQSGRITGVFGALLLRRPAVAAILEDRFDALSPPASLLCHEGDRPVVAYSWGVAAETKAAGAAVLGAAGDITHRLFPQITAFTRAVTPAGRHIALNRYGYRPLRGPDDQLLVKQPMAVEQAA